MAKAKRPFRTERSIEVEGVSRDHVQSFLMSKGFEELREERISRGTAVTQIIRAVSPSGEQVQMRVRLCWRRDGRSRREDRYSAAQMRARLINDSWEQTLEFIEARDRADGNTHILILQYDGMQESFSHAVLIPAPQIGAILDAQRTTSDDLIARGLMGHIKKNHALNGASPTLWLQDDRTPAARLVADVLWNWPGVLDVLKLPGAGKTDVEAGLLWTPAELRGCVSTYRQMWELQQQGRNINKTEWRKRTLDRYLPLRHAGAFEFRMRNISSILDDFDIPIIHGYLPRRNIGPRNYPILIELVNEFWARTGEEEATSDPRKLNTRVRSLQFKPVVLQAKPPGGNATPARQPRENASFKRLAPVIAWVLHEAKGYCEACGEKAPFQDEFGLPFLEVHHVRPLAEGGPDQVDNAAALCPNCHRRLHYSGERSSYRTEVLKRISRLIDYPFIRRPKGVGI